jgi:hypothetical protein
MNKTALPFLKSTRHGQSIVEVVLSIGVAALVIGALVILGTVSLRTALSSARRTEATRIAVSGVEAMRYFRDTQAFANFTAGCYQITTAGAITGPTSCPNTQDGWQMVDLTSSASKQIFNRKIEVVNYGKDAAEQAKMRKVTVTVRWPEGSGETVGGATNQRDVVMSVVLSEWK